MTTKTAKQFKLRPELLEDGDTYIDECLKDSAFQKVWEEESLKVQIAISIHTRRKEKGLSQAKLAKKAQTTQRIISNIEHGEVSVGIDLLQRIAHALDFRVNLSFQ